MIKILIGHLQKPRVIRIMVEISKYDKKVWENYVSNLDTSVLLKNHINLLNSKRNNNKVIFKNEKSYKVAKNIKKKKF